MYGIDVSEHQHSNFDFSQYADGQHFVIIRAGWAQTEDKCFKTFADKCDKLNIPYGVYWYSYALNASQAINEAKAMLRIIAGRNIYCGVWIDMEDADHYKRERGALTQSVCTSVCKAFCDTVANAGYHAGIYASASWFHPNGFIKDTYGYDKWIASWRDGTDRAAAEFMNICSIWQYRGSPLDLDRMFVPISWFCEDAKAPAVKKTVDELAAEVIDGVWGNGESRRAALIAMGYDYTAVQKKVNELLSKKPAPVDEITDLARRTINGEFGNGLSRRLKLGDKYAAVQKKVNEILAGR